MVIGTLGSALTVFSRVLACSIALGVLSLPAHADEIFSCEDGGLVYITSDNREEMYGHPCVKAWFQTNGARQVVARATPTMAATASADALFGRKPASRSVIWLIYAGRDRRQHPTPAPVVRAAAPSRHAAAGAMPRHAAAAQQPRTRKIRFRRR
jgi:hypothetical protein